MSLDRDQVYQPDCRGSEQIGKFMLPGANLDVDIREGAVNISVDEIEDGVICCLARLTQPGSGGRFE